MKPCSFVRFCILSLSLFGCYFPLPTHESPSLSQTSRITTSTATNTNTTTLTTSTTGNNNNKEQNKRKKEKRVVIIVGAGPSGLLFAHYLLRHNNNNDSQSNNNNNNNNDYFYEIHILEKRPDPRQIPPSELRTYPVSLQQKRGIRAIEEISTSLVQAIEEAGGWMKEVHSYYGDQLMVSKPFRSPMLSIDRNQLALVLLQHLDNNNDDDDANLKFDDANAENTSSVHLHFNTNLQDVDVENNIVSFLNNNNNNNSNHGKKWWSSSWWRSSHHCTKEIMKFDYLVAADGSRSVVRQQLTDQGYLSSTITCIPLDAKSFNVLSKCPKGSFQVQKSGFHIWILKNETSAVVLPLFKDNLHNNNNNNSNNKETSDGDDDGNDDEALLCSGVLQFRPYNNPFESTMKAPEQVLNFFQSCAPETIAKLITKEEANNLINRPISKLYSVRCNQLHAKDNILLLGDAAHATDNTRGQGVNAALQDVQIFFKILVLQQQSKKKKKKKNIYNHDDWKEALIAYTQERLPCIQALQEMSEYAIPPTSQLQQESNFRQKIRNLLGPWLGPMLVGHEIMQLLANTDLSYSQIHKKTRWWTDRIKEATLQLEKMKEENGSLSSSTTTTTTASTAASSKKQ